MNVGCWMLVAFVLRIESVDERKEKMTTKYGGGYQEEFNVRAGFNFRTATVEIA